jgi:hypothetical protein
MGMNLYKRSSKTRTLLAIILVPALLATAIPSIFYFPAQRFLLTPDAVTAEILGSNLSERMPDLIAGWIIDGVVQLPDGSSNYLSALSREELSAVIKKVIPADWTAIQTAVIARQTQDYIFGKTDSLAISLDLSDVRANLTGDSLAAMAQQIVGSWNDCSTLDLAELALPVSGDSSAAIPFCQPPDTFRPLVLQVVEIGLQQFGTGLPASYAFQIEPPTATSPGILFLRFLARFLPWTPWFAAGSALLILLVQGGSLRKGFLVIGVPLSLAGVIAAGIGFVLAAVRDGTLTPWLDNLFTAQLPNGLASILTPAMVHVFSRFCLSVMAWGCAAALLGVVLVIVSRLAKQ